MLKRLAYYIVYKDLMQLDICRGIYDAKNGSQEFIDGVALVMEFIANRLSEKIGDEYSDIWVHNVLESERKANV